MGGFIKGIVVGVASFLAGFAVLSVVLPVPQSAPNPAPVVPDTPAAPAATPEPVAEVAPDTPAAPAAEPEPVAEVLPDTPAAPAAAPEPVAEVAPDTPSAPAAEPEPVAEVLPDTPAAPAAAPEPVAEVAPDTPAAPAAEPEPVAEVAPDTPAAPAAAPAPVAGVAPDTPTAPAAAPEPVAGVAPDTPAAPAAAPEPVAEVLPDTPAAPVVTPEPVAGVSPDAPAAPAAAPEAPSEPQAQPVPAQVLPENEPLLPLPAPETAPADAARPDPAPVEPPAGPVVRAMPGSTAAVGVRRGTEGSPPVPRPVEGVTLGRLPAIGAAPDEPLPPAESARPALARHAAAFDLPEGARAMGLVLLDAPEAEAALVDLAYPVTVALDPSDPDAPRRARAYRDAGHEIAILANGLPPLATASDVLVTLNAWTADFPETIALMDVSINGLGAQRALAREVAAQLAPGGYGAIALRDGADAFLQAAREAGLPALPLYRQIDGAGQSGPTIRRLIDRAAFEAQRQSGILILGSAANAETLSALAGFVAQGRAGAGRDPVLLAPTSAVLAGR